MGPLVQAVATVGSWLWSNVIVPVASNGGVQSTVGAVVADKVIKDNTPRPEVPQIQQPQKQEGRVSVRPVPPSDGSTGGTPVVPTPDPTPSPVEPPAPDEPVAAPNLSDSRYANDPTALFQEAIRRRKLAALRKGMLSTVRTPAGGAPGSPALLVPAAAGGGLRQKLGA
jgi:hypothetical protein